MSLINLRKWTLQAVLVIAVVTAYCLVQSPQPVGATPLCPGTITGVPYSAGYAGVVIDLTVKDGDTGNILQYNSTSTNVSVVIKTFNPENGTPAGNIVNLSAPPGNNRTHEQRFYQASKPDNCGSLSAPDSRRDRVGVVLSGHGAGPQSRPVGGSSSHWALDCDRSVHPSYFHKFSFTAEGVPDGRRAGGSWWTGVRAAPNGETIAIVIQYNEPPGRSGQTFSWWGLRAYSEANMTYALPGQSDVRINHRLYNNMGDANAAGNKTKEIQRAIYTPEGGVHSGWATIAGSWTDPRPSQLDGKPWPYESDSYATATQGLGGGYRYCERVYFRPAQGRIVNGNLTTSGHGYSEPACVITYHNWWAVQPHTEALSSWVEPGRSAVFRHGLVSTGTVDSSGFNHGPSYNYNPTNLADTNNSWRDATKTPGSVSANTTWTHNIGINVPDTIGLGRVFCQRYGVDRSSWTAGVGHGGPATSREGCVTVVGGRTTPNVPLVQQYIEPGESVNITGSLATDTYVDGGTGWPGYAVNCTWRATRNDPSNVIAGGGCNRHINSRGTINNIFSYPASGSIGDKICVTMMVTTDNPNFLTATTTNPVCVNIVAKPYFKAYGGDVGAGVGFMSNGSTCNAGSSAGIFSWNRGAATGYAGAGGQFALLASGSITGTVSGAANNPPTRLSFNNESISGETYGGGYNSGACHKREVTPNNATELHMGASINLNTLPYTRDMRPLLYKVTAPSNGRLQIQGGNIPVGEDVIIYVDGDVEITDSIDTNASNAAKPGLDANSIAYIPTFKLIVTGDIFVSGAVEKLYGTYIAQPNDSGNKGRFYTCTPNDPNDPLRSGNYTSCKRPLTVTGTVVAQKVHLLRTHGTQRSAPATFYPDGNAAEIFQYNPLMWMKGSRTPSADPSSPKYDAVTTLPPVL